MKALDHLVARFGSQAEIGRALGLCRQTVHTWKRAGIPMERRLQIVDAAKRLGLRIDIDLVLGKDLTRALKKTKKAAGIKARGGTAPAGKTKRAA